MKEAGSVYGNTIFSGKVQWGRVILSVESGVLIMRNASLNDLVYCFESLEIAAPDPDHKADEVELQKSIQKSKEMMAVIEEYKRRRTISNA